MSYGDQRENGFTFRSAGWPKVGSGISGSEIHEVFLSTIEKADHRSRIKNVSFLDSVFALIFLWVGGYPASPAGKKISHFGANVPAFSSCLRILIWVDGVLWQLVMLWYVSSRFHALFSAFRVDGPYDCRVQSLLRKERSRWLSMSITYRVLITRFSFNILNAMISFGFRGRLRFSVQNVSVTANPFPWF
jgi:hypothetical protein